ncbi:hypothetical protein HH308_20445 [Gordonia sp. TBRC 11910]|uniref:Luciferase-like monooxygenase n=1 Tax=Gordonia asplenii TaxID=2725283 RepID=A0A848KYX9_9ACTN|nr:hypothetical protein [Gordonia asplenii]NMO03589.1 hypothetical protein [Gordonia asplenii]
MTATLTSPASTNALVTVGRPKLQVALAGDDVANTFGIVVRQANLRDAQRSRAVLRAGVRDQANYVVALEIQAAIAPVADSARASAGAATGDEQTVRYVGTAHGLSTLIRDIYAAEVADAVIITPIDGSPTAARVREQVLPLFAEAFAA